MWRARSLARKTASSAMSSGLAQSADALLGDGVAACLIRRDTGSLGPLFEQFLDAFRFGQSRQYRIDIHAVALAEP